MSQSIAGGAYKFIDELTMPSAQIEQTVSFISNSVAFSGFRITTDTMYYVKSDGTETEVYNTSTKWETESTLYQSIILSSIEASDTFGTWFIQNATLDNFTAVINYEGKQYKVGGQGGEGGGYVLPIASATELGGVKIGDNLTIDETGKVSGAAPYTLPVANATRLGGVKKGSGVNIAADGTISAQEYSLPTMTASVKGGAKVDGITTGMQGEKIEVITDGESIQAGTNGLEVKVDGTTIIKGENGLEAVAQATKLFIDTDNQLTYDSMGMRKYTATEDCVVIVLSFSIVTAAFDKVSVGVYLNGKIVGELIAQALYTDNAYPANIVLYLKKGDVLSTTSGTGLDSCWYVAYGLK